MVVCDQTVVTETKNIKNVQEEIKDIIIKFFPGLNENDVEVKSANTNEFDHHGNKRKEPDVWYNIESNEITDIYTDGQICGGRKNKVVKDFNYAMLLERNRGIIKHISFIVYDSASKPDKYKTMLDPTVLALLV